MNAAVLSSDAYVQFLPSEHGRGFKGTFRRDLGGTFDGWRKWYGHLRGVASYPPEWFTFDEWTVEVVTKLRAQGVEFV